MTGWDDIETAIAGATGGSDAAKSAAALVAAGEAILENWVAAHGEEPTGEEREGFRLLALHRQGARGEPSFNACRETCRELAYHYNLIQSAPTDAETPARIEMMSFVASHLLLFVRGKLEVANLGDFCCSSRPIRTQDADVRRVETRS